MRITFQLPMEQKALSELIKNIDTKGDQRRGKETWVENGSLPDKNVHSKGVSGRNTQKASR